MQETTRKYQQLTDYWTKCCYLSLHFSLFTAACASFAFLSGTVFSVFGHRYSAKLNATSDHSRGTWFFSKLSLAKYHFLHKKPVFTVISIYFISCLQLTTEKFHVFIYYSTSLQIFLFYKFFCTNISTIFRSSHQKCSIKKLLSVHFVIFTGKHLWWSLFFNKVEGHQTCGFIKKRLQHMFSCEFREIYKNTYFEKN